MKAVKMLTLFVLAVLFVCQASASVATWQEETITLEGSSWSWAVLEGIVDVVHTVADPNLDVTIQKAGPEYIHNGDLENPYRTYNIITEGRDKYTVPLQGDLWRNLDNSKNGPSQKIFWPNGVARNGSFPNGTPSGDKCIYVYTRYDDINEKGTPDAPLEYRMGYPDYWPRTMEATCQLLPYVTFDPAVPITLSAMVGKFPAAQFPWNGYALQIAVGGENVDIPSAAYRSHITGGTVIAEYYVDPNSGPAENEWESASVTYDATDPMSYKDYAGLPIQVRCVVYENPEDPNYSTTYAAAFDDIAVTVNGETVMGDAPDPVVQFISSEGEIKYVTVYDDVCDMSRGIGTLAGDINKDCQVNLLDMAVVAETWLALPEDAPVITP